MFAGYSLEDLTSRSIENDAQRLFKYSWPFVTVLVKLLLEMIEFFSSTIQGIIVFLQKIGVIFNSLGWSTTEREPYNLKLSYLKFLHVKHLNIGEAQRRLNKFSITSRLAISRYHILYFSSITGLISKKKQKKLFYQ